MESPPEKTAFVCLSVMYNLQTVAKYLKVKESLELSGSWKIVLYVENA